MNTVLPAPDRPVTPSRTVGLIRPALNSPSAAVARRISSVMSARLGTRRDIGAPETFHQRRHMLLGFGSCAGFFALVAFSAANRCPLRRKMLHGRAQAPA